jgi:hypothetical protein
MANNEVTISIEPLFGETTVLKVNNDIIIALLIRKISEQVNIPPSKIELLFNGCLIEKYGLGTKFQEIIHEEKEVSIQYILKLRAYGYALGSLHRLYNSHLEKFVLSDDADASRYGEFDMILSSIQQSMTQVEREVKATRTQVTVNKEDPITLEELKNPIVWFQNGKVFGMNIDYLKDYVKNHSFQDENGERAIKNPYTNEIIPFPWNQMLFKSAHQ